MAQLTVTELRKRDNFRKLLNKIRAGEPLMLTRKKQEELRCESVVVTPEPYLLVGLSKLVDDPELEPSAVIPELTAGNVLLLPIGAETIPSGALQKTWEFGSKTTEMVYEKEGREHRHLKESLKRLTVFGMKPIRLTIKTSTDKTFVYDNVLSVQTASRVNGISQKADFEFINSRGVVVARVSHKFGTRARDFRQWSGIKEFWGHPEVEEFGKDLNAYIKESHPDANVFPSALCLARHIQDDDLKRQAIYGQGPSAVDFLIQGRCEFKQTDKFEACLTAPLILSKNESVDILPESYQPVILVRRGDLQRGSFGIKGCRGVIYPAHGRKIHAYI